MPNSDPRDGFFYPTLILMIDSYNSMLGVFTILKKSADGKNIPACKEFVIISVHCEPGKAFKDEKCVVCDVGTYKEAAGNTNCNNCPANSTTPETGSLSEAECSLTLLYLISVHCEPGKAYRDNKCVVCDVGTYKEVAGNTNCINCPANSTTPGEGSVNEAPCSLTLLYLISVHCEPGKAFKVDKCVVCDVGTYKEAAGNTNCISCPANSTTPGEGSVNEVHCSLTLLYPISVHCEPGKAYKDNKCVVWDVGTYKEAAGNTNCMNCLANSTTPGEGSVNEAPCSLTLLYLISVHCEPGKAFKVDKCVVCDVGTYKEAAGNTNCISCPAISTTPGEGSVSEAECSLTLLYLISVHCEPGKAFKVDKCVVCDVGTYKEAAGNTNCISCPANSTTPGEGSVSEAECSLTLLYLISVHCEPGKAYKDNKCVVCDVGTYKEVAGNTTLHQGKVLLMRHRVV